MSVVPKTTKRSELASRIKTAAERHVGHDWVVKEELVLAAHYQTVSRYDRRQVMVPANGDVTAYCEVIPTGSQVLQEDSRGRALIVSHQFSIWLVYGFQEGSSQATWDNVTDGVSPDGVLRELRQTGAVTATNAAGNPDTILFRQPDIDEDIIPLGSDGGQVETAHEAAGTISIEDVQ